jgi:hypothetical protein
LEKLHGVRELRREQDELTFTLAGEDTVAVTRALTDAGVGINQLVREQTTLE